MFVGRDRELKKLNALYTSSRFEFVVFYGRRRVKAAAFLKNRQIF